MDIVFTAGVDKWKVATGVTKEINRLICKHLAEISSPERGTYGELCAADIDSQEGWKREKGMMMSIYTVADKKVWIITDPGWAVTTALFPEEY